MVDREWNKDRIDDNGKSIIIYSWCVGILIPYKPHARHHRNRQPLHYTCYYKHGNIHNLDVAISLGPRSEQNMCVSVAAVVCSIQPHTRILSQLLLHPTSASNINYAMQNFSVSVLPLDIA